MLASRSSGGHRFTHPRQGRTPASPHNDTEALFHLPSLFISKITVRRALLHPALTDARVTVRRSHATSGQIPQMPDRTALRGVARAVDYHQRCGHAIHIFAGTFIGPQAAQTGHDRRCGGKGIRTPDLWLAKPPL